MQYSLILDILVAFLLVVTIGYAMVLNKRLGHLRRDKGELEKLALSFTDATGRADGSIATLKSTADDLQDRIDKAGSLHDDLVFLIDRGSVTADRLETTVRAARDESAVGGVSRSEQGLSATKPAAVTPARAAPNANPANRVETAETPASEAEKKLLKAIRKAG
ncbi:MAG: hypothetical protein CFH05_00723 [Alphaproteobacteria bacterium MarineAlpha3_Bin4]|nr:DUF6468 domain-containing protein [Pseudomonadota bacterium]PPR75351.1 MAG: hypothetical protein CFH05_00723 [Alphaproteobacteria bacterium MarineAlpha3_Bin4]